MWCVCVVGVGLVGVSMLYKYGDAGTNLNPTPNPAHHITWHQLAFFSMTIGECQSELVNFFVLFSVLFVGFAIAGWHLFGFLLDDYRKSLAQNKTQTNPACNPPSSSHHAPLHPTLIHPR